jgi:plasmid stability protein
MPTLYIKDVPEDLYEALRERSRRNRTSMAFEVIELIRQAVPTPAESKRRLRLVKLAERLRSMQPTAPGPFPSAEEMQREDRSRRPPFVK